jgi:hypothetical protein
MSEEEILGQQEQTEETKINPYDSDYQMTLLSVVERKTLEALRTAIRSRLDSDSSGDFAQFVDEDCLRRFVQARPEGTKLTEILRLLNEALDFRIKHSPQTLRCYQCTESPLAHNCRTVGLDMYKRPVVYTCFSQAHDRYDPKGAFEHMMQVMETATQLMKVNKVTRWVFLIDFNGFGLRDNNPLVGLEFIKALKLFPERLASAYIIDAPWIFNKCWAVLKRVIDSSTAANIHFVEHKALRSLEEDNTKPDVCFGEELLQWLEVEMQENRLDYASLPSQSPQHKRYWEWFRVETKQTNDERPPRKAHDPRGTRSFMSSPQCALVQLALDKHVQSLQYEPYIQPLHEEATAVELAVEVDDMD